MYWITAFLGNVPIIVGPHQEQSLLCVNKTSPLSLFLNHRSLLGLVAQPLYDRFLLFKEHSKHCYYSTVLSKTIAVIFWGVSWLTMTAISVDRLLGLLLSSRYRQVVTLSRVRLLVVSFWVSNFAFVIILFLYRDMAIRIMCINVIIHRNLDVLSHQNNLTLNHHQAQVQEEAHPLSNGRGTAMDIAWYSKTVSNALWGQMTFVLACYIPYGILSKFALSELRSSYFDLACFPTIVCVQNK